MKNYTYYGRGPVENYADRKAGQFIEQYKSTVADQFVNFPKPQDMGNHEDVRWCALTDKAGKGALFVATNRLFYFCFAIFRTRYDIGRTSSSVTEGR